MRIGKCPKCIKQDLVYKTNCWNGKSYLCLNCGFNCFDNDLKEIKEQYNKQMKGGLK
jgi:Zn ribbon nucleic-acid-binding protein